MDAPNPYMMQRMMPPGMAPMLDKPEPKAIPIPLPKSAPEDKKPTTLPLLEDKGDKAIPEIKPSSSVSDNQSIPNTMPDSKPTTSDDNEETDDPKPPAPPPKKPGRQILP
jgi:hypothetical protein